MTGKEFEQKFKQSCEEQGVLFVRFRDAGFVGDKSSQRRFTVKNIADCFVFNNNMLAILELKHRKQSLAFKDITQSKDLLKTNKFIEDNSILNSTVGLLVCFGDLDKVYYLHVSAIEEIKSMTGKKSFNYKDCDKLIEEHPLMCIKVSTLKLPRKRNLRIAVDFLDNIL